MVPRLCLRTRGTSSPLYGRSLQVRSTKMVGGPLQSNGAKSCPLNMELWPGPPSPRGGRSSQTRRVGSCNSGHSCSTRQIHCYYQGNDDQHIRAEVEEISIENLIGHFFHVDNLSPRRKYASRGRDDSDIEKRFQRNDFCFKKVNDGTKQL